MEDRYFVDLENMVSFTFPNNSKKRLLNKFLNRY